MKEIVLKEILEKLFSPYYILLFAASCILILVSSVLGTFAFKQEMSAASTANANMTEHSARSLNYKEIMRAGITVRRKPDKMSVYNKGINSILGRRSEVTGTRIQMRLQDSELNLNPVVAVFGSFDLHYTVTFILSLFTLIISHGAVNGERERGTLRLIMANPIKRTSVVIGKIIGCYIPSILLFVVPFILSNLTILFISETQITSYDWIRVLSIFFFYLVYLFLFTSLGVAVSALTKTPFTSFITCIVIWVLFTSVIPNLTISISSTVFKVKPIDEVENNIRNYKKDRDGIFLRRFAENLKKKGITTAELYDRYQLSIYEMTKKEIRMEDDRFEDQVYSEHSAKRVSLYNNARRIALVSPVSSLNFAVNRFSNTGAEMLDYYEKALLNYRTQLRQYLQDKQNALEKEGKSVRRDKSSLSIKQNGDIVFNSKRTEVKEDLDLSDMPSFFDPQMPYQEMLSLSLLEIISLMMHSLIYVAIAYVAFLRYDVR